MDVGEIVIYVQRSLITATTSFLNSFNIQLYNIFIFLVLALVL